MFFYRAYIFVQKIYLKPIIAFIFHIAKKFLLYVQRHAVIVTNKETLLILRLAPEYQEVFSTRMMYSQNLISCYSVLFGWKELTTGNGFLPRRNLQSIKVIFFQGYRDGTMDLKFTFPAF